MDLQKLCRVLYTGNYYANFAANFLQTNANPTFTEGTHMGFMYSSYPCINICTCFSVAWHILNQPQLWNAIALVYMFNKTDHPIITTSGIIHFYWRQQAWKGKETKHKIFRRTHLPWNCRPVKVLRKEEQIQLIVKLACIQKSKTFGQLRFQTQNCQNFLPKSPLWGFGWASYTVSNR